ncbi:MAG TPA: PAS domain S-box protein [Spirochaetota bacterium]|nr:PAS domain S-box protein [Spirochaetota bacterium]
MDNRNKKILLIEDENITATKNLALLKKHGYSVVRATSGEKAVEIFNLNSDIDLILADIELGEGIDGTEAVKRILEKRTIPVVFISGYSSHEVIEKTEGITSYGFIFKNGGDAILLTSVKIAIRLFEAEKNICKQKEELEDTNEEMQATMEEMEAINSNLTEIQSELLKSESEFRSLFDSLLVGVGILIDRRFKKVNNYLCRMTGFEEKELLNASTEILYNDITEFERVGKELYDMLQRDGHGVMESLMRRKGGGMFDALLTIGPLYPDNLAAGVCATVTDISELKNTENALRESEMKFKAVMEQSTLPMLIVNSRGGLVDANLAWERLWEYDKIEAIGRYNVLSDAQLHLLKPLIDKALEGSPVDLPELRYKRPSLNGDTDTSLWVTGRAYPLKDCDGKVSNVVIIIEDITERKRAEEAMRLSEEKFRNIFNNMTVGYFRTGIDGTLIDVNPACLKIFGFETFEEAKEFSGNTTENVYVSEKEWNTVRDKMITAEASFIGNVMLRRKDGTEFKGGLNMRVVPSAEGQPLYIEGLVEDVTERERTQEMLIQSEKMITVAGLAAGMAHEINNPLGIIMQNAENALHRMLDDLPGNFEAAESVGTDFQKIKDYASARRIDRYLTAVRDAGSRAAKIVANMLKFSRGTESKFDYLNINNVIDKALDLASNDYDLKSNYDFRKIKIVKNYSDLPDVPCAETQIEQVFLTIFKNSAHAMMRNKPDESREHSIRISTFKDDGFVKIEVSDNGPGMDGSTRKRIFEPFFTSSISGGGAGLGLSVPYYIIVTGHDGTISVESAPGKGSKFTITLPVQRRE